MRVTVQDIAREAGVSTATVDRVLNGRPGVRSLTLQHVLATAERLGYVLTESDPPAPLRLAFLLPEGTNAFIQSLAHEVISQTAQLAGVTTKVETIEGFDPAALAQRLTELEGQIDGLGLIALDHPVVREAARALGQSGVKIVTLASDIQAIPRIAYIGIDNRQAGRMAGYLMGRFLGPQAKGKVALFAGSLSYRGHQEREMGFRHILHEEFPDLSIVELREILDDREKAATEARLLLEKHPDLAGIYNVGGGSTGIARALHAAGKAQKITMIGHEATSDNKALLLDGTMDAVIDQNPRAEIRECLTTLLAALRGEEYQPMPPRLHAVFRENLPED